VRVEFAGNQLRRAYEQSAQATRRWGVDVARKYISRTDALFAAADFEVVKQLRTLRAHRLEGRYQGRWALDLTGRWRLIIRPSRDGKAVMIEEVTNHYGD
jgi:plasmid maintenance system killer protein